MSITHEESVPPLSRLGLVSADSHVNEPRNLWRDNLPPSLRSQAMRASSRASPATGSCILEGERSARSEADESAAQDGRSRASLRASCARKASSASASIPTTGLYVWLLTDPDVMAASCRVYNEWIADGLGRLPRFKCAGLVPSSSVEHADRSEVGRSSPTPASESVMIPAVATPDWNHRTWDAAVVGHRGDRTPRGDPPRHGPQHVLLPRRGRGCVQPVGNAVDGATRAAALLANAGVFAFHPKLHVVFVEYNVGWLGWAMDTLDFYTKSFAKYGVSPEGKKWINPELPNCRATTSVITCTPPSRTTRSASTTSPTPAPTPLLWGSDYPHEEGTYPHSRDVVARLAKGLDRRAQRRSSAATRPSSTSATTSSTPGLTISATSRTSASNAATSPSEDVGSSTGAAGCTPTAEDD